MSIGKLVSPRSIAVIGASQKRGRGSRVLENLTACGFSGDVFAVHPEYDHVGGFPCVPSVADLPTAVDCMVVAISADAACATLEQGFARGIEAAVVLAAGFGEGGHGEARVARLAALGARGMSICGPNCYGALNVRTGAAAFSGALPKPLRPGKVALISQSGGLGANAFTPLMQERRLGFSHFISCGNQLVTHIEDYLAHFVEDTAVEVIAIVVEALKSPEAFFRSCLRAHELGKTVIVFQAGQSDVGQQMARSHTGALATNRDIARAFWRRCGVIAPRHYDEFVETIVALSVVPQRRVPDADIIVVSGSGGGAAVVADNVEDTALSFASLDDSTVAGLRGVLPEFGSINNPIDATGALSDNPALLPAVYEVLLGAPGNSMIATAVSAWPSGKANSRRFARILAEAAARSDRVLAAYSPSPLGGPLDAEVIDALHGAGVPMLLGLSNSMRALQHVPQRAERNVRDRRLIPAVANRALSLPSDYVGRSNFLAARGVSMAEARLARDADEAVAAFRAFDGAVAVKIEAADILHKSDIGGVRLNCASEADVRRAYEEIIADVHRAGFQHAREVVVQEMRRGALEAYAAIIHDPVFGSVITCGLGGVFIEILGDVGMEMAPVSRAQAHEMILRLRGAALMRGARGRPQADVEALADLLVALGRVAAETAGQFRTLELNPVMVGVAGEGVVAVDIAIE